MLEDTLLDLETIESVKFGQFTLKTGIISPVYFDLRVMVSKPSLMNTIAQLLWECFCKNGDKNNVELLCGVPYTALPLATLISVFADKPMVVKRKEAKQYGTKKLLEGKFTRGQNCLIVEDVITSGSSVLETAEILKSQGLVVTDVLVFLDREQGGKENLENNGLRVHSVTTVTKLMSALLKYGKIDQNQFDHVVDFLEATPTSHLVKKPDLVTLKSIEMRKQAADCESIIVKKLFDVMISKSSNLCVAVDVKKTEKLLEIADKVGPHICVLKTHVDILEDWDPDSTPDALRHLAAKHDFLLFEDRKLADIGNTVSGQFHDGPYKMSQWANFVTFHGLPGPGLLDSLKISKTDLQGALVVAEMSSAGNLADKEYADKCTKMVLDHPAGVGVIAQSRLDNTTSGFVQMTPGVGMGQKGDSLGQQYIEPEEAVCGRGADVIIVGRGVAAATDPAEAALKYKTAGWNAYKKRISEK